MPEADIHPHFHKVKDRLALPTYHGGYRIQEWREYIDAAFVGMISRSYQTSHHKIGKKRQCAFPAMQAILSAAAREDEGKGKEKPVAWVGVAAGDIDMVTDVVQAYQARRRAQALRRRVTELGM